MSQAQAQEGPTFKLVLVGDGGTGKDFRLDHLFLDYKFLSFIFRLQIFKIG